MKKLMFATALVASAVAFADPLNAISFEGDAEGASVLGLNGASRTDTAETGGATPGMYFWYEGDTDGSTVKAFGGQDTLPLPGNATPRPFFFADAGVTRNNYLELSTEGGTLWRSIGTVQQNEGGSPWTNGIPVAVANTGTYLDTLVQFTPTEDGGAPELGDNDKLAIWLNVDGNGVTNLMVKAGSYGDDGSLALGGASYVLNGKTVVAGEWYRLTVKAVDNILPANDYYKVPGFQVFIDGVEMSATTSPLSAEWLASLQEGEVLSAAQVTELSSGKYLPSLVAGENGVDSTLEGVGFKGSGAIDDLVWTEEDPLQGGAGGDNYEVTIGNTPVPITPTAADLAAIAAAAQAAGQTIDVTDTAAVNALLATEIGNTGIQAWEAAFLGVEPSADGLEQVAIKSISFDEDGKVVVEMADEVVLKTGRGVTINLILKGSDDLTTWTTLQTATDTTEFTAITPAANETKKFYKVVVEFAATPAQN